ncbi:unnamed protein product [Lasius platythorax]|uniref:Uncharacterized protein n=1 Tax=Lasius platythorax TaxID=488582 RepID=A0AAV2MYS2_9HYME
MSYISPQHHIGASAIEQLEDVDIIRAGSGSFQGALSGQMKSKVKVLKEIIRIMAERIDDIGDPGYLRRKNAELLAELAVSRRETAQLRRDLSDLQRIVQDLKTTMGSRDADYEVSKSEKATSPITPIPKRNTRSRERTKTPAYPSGSNTKLSAEDTVMRPALKDVSTPIPAVERNVTIKYKNMETAVFKQIVDLIAKKRKFERPSR